jgi:2-iminobutanoate/2-iminopropanoate deaminase
MLERQEKCLEAILKKQIISVPGIPVPESPFNHVVKAGDFIFLTSQLSTDLKTGKIISGDITVQTTLALENVKFLLQQCQATMDDIVKVVIYMRNIKEFDRMNAVYRKYFTVGSEPARVTVQATSPIKDIDIEIEVTAIASTLILENS